jgi:hypothetical protein
MNRLLWAIAGGFLGVYVIVQNLNVPLIIQPQLMGALSLLSWTQVRLVNFGILNFRVNLFDK